MPALISAAIFADADDAGGVGLAPLDLFADVDITELQVHLSGDGEVGDAVSVYEREKEDEREGHDALNGEKRSQHTERRRLQLVASARRHRNRKKVATSIDRRNHRDS